MSGSSAVDRRRGGGNESTMSEVIIYGPPASSYLRTVRMTCIEKNISYELRLVDFGGESHRAPSQS
jgi:hypothetical protein